MKILLDVRPPVRQVMYLHGVEDIICTGFEESLFDCNFTMEIKSVEKESVTSLDCSSKFVCVILTSSICNYIVIPFLYMALMEA